VGVIILIVDENPPGSRGGVYNGSMNSERGIQVGLDAQGNVMITGDNNRVTVVHASRTVSTADDSPPPAIGPNPYLGLAAFTEAEAGRFFGREALTRRLWAHFRDLQSPPPGEQILRLLPVLGPSGCGKSSVVRAGLIPELARQPLPGRRATQVALLVPGAHPLESLGRVLARLVHGETSVARTEEQTAALRKRSQAGRHDGLRRIADELPDLASAPLVVLVDQFEEIYTLCEDAEERDAFVANLLEAASDAGGGVTVVLTLRSDFLGHTQRHARLNQLIARQSVIVEGMAPEELRDAIARPAEQAGHPLESGTVSLLVEQSEGREGALPLLQFALTRIWQGLADGKSPADTLRDIRGVVGALADEAERRFQSLPESDRVIARRAFLAMVRLGEGTLGEGTRYTRRRVVVDNLVAHGEDPDHIRAVLQRFAERDARLITLGALDQDGGDDAGEITHEALFEHWKTLKGWLETGREDLRFQRRLEDAVRYWKDQGRPEGSLWQRPDLDLLRQYHDRHERDFTHDQLDFFQAAMARERRSQRIRISAVLVLLLLVVVSTTVGSIAYQEQDRAERRFEDLRQLANQFIFDFHEEIKDLYGSTPARKMLVRTARQHLHRLRTDTGYDEDLLLDLAESHSRLGDIEIQLGNGNSALQSYKTGLDIVETLVSNDPSNIPARRKFAIFHQKLGDTYVRQGNLTKALEVFSLSLNILEKISEDDSANASAKLKLDLATSFSRVGDTLADQGHLDKAQESFQLSFEIIKELADNDPSDTSTQRYLYVSYEKLGEILAKQGNVNDALEFFQLSLDIAEKLADNAPLNAAAQRDLYAIFIKFGDIFTSQKKHVEASKFFQSSLGIAEKLADRDPENIPAQQDLALSYEKLGDTLIFQKKLTEALGFFQKSLKIRKIIADQDLSDASAQRDLAVSFNKVGDTLKAQGNLDEALDFFRQDLAISEKLAADDPSSATAQTDLVISLGRLGSSLAGRPATAAQGRDYLERGLKHLRELRDENRLNSQQIEWIVWFKKQIEESAR